MQLVLPATSTVSVTETPWSVEQEHLVEPDREIDLPLFIYNFSEKALSGTVTAESVPAGWILSPTQWETSLQPMDRQPLTARFSMPRRDFSKTSECWIRLRAISARRENPSWHFA
jgi:hypothetical protein